MVDLWTDQMGRSVLGVSVVAHDISIPLAATDISDIPHEHTAIAAAVKNDLEVAGIVNNVSFCCSDDAGNTRAARTALAAMPGFTHITPLRCYMHAFALLLGNITSHEWATEHLKRAQKVVTFFRKSSLARSRLEAARAVLKPDGIVSGGYLESSNKTRLTSVELMLGSLLRNKAAFAHMLRVPSFDKSIVPDEILGLIDDTTDAGRVFWADSLSLHGVLQPIAQVVMAIQRRSALLAEICL